MRTIKFRFYSQNKETKKWSVYEQNLEDIENEDSWQGGNGNWVRKAVCQFTGLKDKNGKEIYESDIIKFVDTGGKGEVRFDKGLQGEPAVWEGTFWGWVVGETRPLVDDYGEIEVIGNIYENPNLLTQRDN